MASTDFPTRLGAAVAAQRRARKLTQENLAETVGVSTEWISQMERGIGTPSIDMLIRLAEVLGVSAATLLSAAEGSSKERPAVQRVTAVAQTLSDDAVAVLEATAEALAAMGGNGR